MCQMDKDITEHFPIPDDIRKLANMANNDLYNGPTYYNQEGNVCAMFEQGGEITPFDFVGACAQVSDWCGDNINRIYYTECGAVMEHEPDGEADEDGNWLEPEPYYEIDSLEIKRILFGRELAGHV